MSTRSPGSFPKSGAPPPVTPITPGIIPLSIVRQMQTPSAGRITLSGSARQIQVECQDVNTLSQVVSQFTAHETAMQERALKFQMELHQHTLMHQQCQFQTMLNMMSQPQWSLPAYGPQSVHTIRVHPYESPVPPRPPPALTLVENTSSAAPPEIGLFMHTWGSELLSSEVLTSSDLIPAVSVTFHVGRVPDRQKVRETRYPHLPHCSTPLWVFSPIPRIKFGLFESVVSTDSMKQIDWSAIYEMLRRIRPSLVQFQHRITNALEEGRLREVQQAYAPDPRYYIAVRGFTPSAEIGVYSQHYVKISAR